MSKLTESQINPADVKALFRDASNLRSKPTLGGKFFKSLRKDAISIDDLQQSWKEDGYPDDIRDIKRILLSHGFDKKEIAKIFSEVFGKDENDPDSDHAAPAASATILKIADYAKKKGLTDRLIKFMEQEFANELGTNRRATTEDIRTIFTKMLNEERPHRRELINTQESEFYGRKKK